MTPTHCRRSHPLDTANLYLTARRWGCRACRGDSYRRNQALDPSQYLNDLRARFIQRGPDECWLWTGKISEGGYGKFRGRSAHRSIYEALVGPVPDGLELDHLCHTQDLQCQGGRTCSHRRCVSPDHLEPVTRRGNALRGRSFSALNAQKTACLRGHELSPLPNGGGRYCATCQRQHTAAKNARTSAALRAAREAERGR